MFSGDRMDRYAIFLILSLLLLLPPASALDTAVPAVRARGSQTYSPLSVWDMGFTGRGVGVAIIDGGVDDEHPDLKGRFVAGVDLTVPDTPLTPRDGSLNPDDNGGHGTFCAGCIMGNGNSSDGRIMGVAPEATLIDVKVYRALEAGRLAENIVMPAPDRLIEALQWIVDHKGKFNIRVVSISLSVGVPNSNGTDRLSQVVNEVVGAGIVVVVASGNEGPDNRGFNPPAAADGAIVVGAVDDKGTVLREDDTIADFSSRGPRASDGDADPFDEFKPDCVAPGVEITSLANSFSSLPAAGYSTASGTSFAAPMVAGIVALMIEANPSLTPQQVKEILHMTAEPRGTPYDPDLPYPHNKWNPEYGYGIVDAYEAVRMALALRGDSLPAPHLNEIPSPDDDGNFTLTWSSVPGAESYVLLESDDPTFSHYTAHDHLTETFYPVVGLSPGNYYFGVVARGGGTFSNMSNTVSVVVTGGGEPPPPLPTPRFEARELSVEEGENYSVFWSPVEGASTYILQEATASDFSDSKDLYRGGKTTYHITGRAPGDYFYRVKAVGEGRESPWSAPLTVHVHKGNESTPGPWNQTEQPPGGGGKTSPEEKGEVKAAAVVIAASVMVAITLLFVYLKRRGGATLPA